MAEDRILPNLKTRLTLDTSELAKGKSDVADLKGQLGQVGSGFEGSARAQLVPGIGRVAGDMARVFAAAKIFSIGRDGLAELGDAQEKLAVTEAHIKSTGGAANVTAADVTNLAGSLSSLSGVDDEVIQGGENMLLTFKRIRNEAGAGNDVFNQATAAALDLSKSGFGSVESASVLLGKALDDPIKGVTALQRVGVALTESEKEQVRAFVASGDVLSAQKVILGEVESQVGGTAKAYGDTLPGQIDKAKNASDEMKGALVGGMAPALTLGANAATFLATEVTKLPEPLQAIVGITALVGGGIAAVARPVHDLINLFRLLKPAQLESAAAAGVDAAAQEADAAAAETNTAAHGSLIGKLGTAGVVAAAAAAAVAIYAYGQSLNKTTLSTEEVNKLTSATPEALRAVGEELLSLAQKGGAFGGALDDTIAKLVAMGPPGVGTLQKIRDQLAESGKDTSVFDRALAGAKTSEDNLASSTDAGNKVLDAGAVSADDYAGALKRLQDAQLAMTGQVLDQFDAQLRLSDAQVSSRKAVEDLTAVIKDHKASEDDRTSASNKAYEAIIAEAKASQDLYLSTHTAADGTRDAAGANRALITELTNVASTLDPGSPLKKQLNDYIWTLTIAADKANDPQQLHLDTSDATNAVLTWLHFVQNLSPVDVTFHASTGGNFSQRARGGPVEAGVPYLVGDKYGLANAELFVPSESGMIIPDLPRFGSQPGGDQGPSIGLNIENAHFGSDSREAVDDLDFYARVQLAGV